MSAVVKILLFIGLPFLVRGHDISWCKFTINILGPEDLKTLGTKCTSTYQNQHGQEGYARQVVDLCLLRNGNVTNPVNLLNFGECVFNTIYHSCLDTDPKTTITHACHYSSQLESMDDVNQNCEKFATDCFEKYETFVKPKFTDIQREVPTWCTKKSNLILNSAIEETGIETAIRCIELDESVNTSEPDNSWWARKRDQHLMCTMQSIFSSEHKSKSSSKTAMLEACEFYKTFGLIGSCEEFTEKCYSKLSDVYPELMETNSMQSTCGTENGNHLDPKQIISIWSRLSGNSIAEGCQRLYSEVDTSNFTENAGYCTYNTIFTLWRHDPIEAKKQFESACEYYENDQGKGFAPNCAEFSSKCLEHYSVTDNVTNVEDKVADWCSSDAEFVEIPCPQDEYCGNDKVLKCYEKMGATSFSNWITDTKAASCSFRSGFIIADENQSKIILTDTCLFYTRLGYKGDCKAFTEKCYTALNLATSTSSITSTIAPDPPVPPKVNTKAPVEEKIRPTTTPADDGEDEGLKKQPRSEANQKPAEEEEGPNLVGLWVVLAIVVVIGAIAGIVVGVVLKRRQKKKKEKAKALKSSASSKNNIGGELGLPGRPAAALPGSTAKGPARKPPAKKSPAVKEMKQMEAGVIDKGFKSLGPLTVDVAIRKGQKIAHATGDDDGREIDKVIFDHGLNNVVDIGSNIEKVSTEELATVTVDRTDNTVEGPSRKGRSKGRIEKIVVDTKAADKSTKRLDSSVKGK